MAIFNAILNVAGLALLFGAGIPLLFALGMRCMTGDPVRDANGVIVGDTATSGPMKALGWGIYVLLGLFIVVAILWISKDSIHHYSGIDLFPGLSSKH